MPIVCTGNDFSTLYAPLIRDGRMEKFYWNPTREDRIGVCMGIFQVGAGGGAGRGRVCGGGMLVGWRQGGYSRPGRRGLHAPRPCRSSTQPPPTRPPPPPPPRRSMTT